MFEIITVHRTYCLSAENDLEYSNWIYALADGVPDWDPQPSKPRRTVSTFTTLEDMVRFLFFLNFNDYNF